MAQQIITLFILAFLWRTSIAHWSYKDLYDGSDGWTGVCVTGRHQSPINLSPIFAIKTTHFQSLSFLNYGRPPPMDLESLTNNGHTVTFSLDNANDPIYPKISDGGLPGSYRFSQFHFHWGSDDERGSEHTLNGYHSPMELHIVHFNEKYGRTFDQAVANSKDAWDTLAVIGVFFQLHQDDNHHFDQIVEELQFIKYSNQVAPVNRTISLHRLLPKDLNSFWRYNGSLTTPPCSEVVIWTMFKERIPISINQLNRFRELLDVSVEATVSVNNSSESDNFRPTQPMNGRSLLDVTITPKVFQELEYIPQQQIHFPPNRPNIQHFWPWNPGFLRPWQFIPGFWQFK